MKKDIYTMSTSKMYCCVLFALCQGDEARNDIKQYEGEGYYHFFWGGSGLFLFYLIYFYFYFILFILFLNIAFYFIFYLIFFFFFKVVLSQHDLGHMLTSKEVMQLAVVSMRIFKVISLFISENFIFKYVSH